MVLWIMPLVVEITCSNNNRYQPLATPKIIVVVEHKIPLINSVATIEIIAH